MIRSVIALSCCLSGSIVWSADGLTQNHPSFDYDTARSHEIKPHRSTISVDGVREGFNQLRVTLKVSPAGEVINAEAGGGPDLMKYWPQLESEVLAWRFVPFKKHGKPVIAQVEEYIDLVPPERLPKSHAAAPSVHPDSNVTIVLKRGACYGTCPSYDVVVSTSGIEFEGHSCVAELGKHTAPVDGNAVRELARKFVAANFYSLDDAYEATVTDMPAYVLSIGIDGQEKQVTDYVGRWVGMPAIVRELEDDVDVLAKTGRWVQGEEGNRGRSHMGKRLCAGQR